MKRLLRKTLWVVGLVCMLWPAIGFGDELPLEKRVARGFRSSPTRGRPCRFVTPISLNVTFQSVSPSVIHLKFVAPAPSPGGHTITSETRIAVYWVNFGTDVYSGGAPVGKAWEGDLNTEGGFVDR